MELTKREIENIIDGIHNSIKPYIRNDIATNMTLRNNVRDVLYKNMGVVDLPSFNDVDVSLLSRWLIFTNNKNVKGLKDELPRASDVDYLIKTHQTLFKEGVVLNEGSVIGFFNEKIKTQFDKLKLHRVEFLIPREGDTVTVGNTKFKKEYFSLAKKIFIGKILFDFCEDKPIKVTSPAYIGFYMLIAPLSE